MKQTHTLWHRLWEYMDRAGFCEHAKGFKIPDWSKLRGWGGLTLMRHYRRYNPAVREIVCDDSHATGSRLFLIPHETDEEYWGTTAIFVPQYGDHNIMIFHDLNELIDELVQLRDRQYAKTPEEWR